MTLSRTLLAAGIASVVLIASCSTTRHASRLLDWDVSQVKGPVRLAFVGGPAELNELDDVDIYDIQQHVQVFARIVDTAGNLFRLPRGVRASWSLMGSDDRDPFYLEGFDEAPHGGNPLRIVSIRKGQAEGQLLYLIPFQPRTGISYGLRVSLRLGQDIVLEDFIPITLHLR